MKVKLARTAGFCMGVRRAVEIVLEEANRGQGSIVTYGPLIHNTQVLDLLADKGIRAVSELSQVKNGETAVIRAHGVPPSVKDDLRRSTGRVIDATCPRVVKVQMIIKSYTQRGYRAIIVGDRDHAEVKGLLGYGHGRGVVVASAEEVAGLEPWDQVIVVAQTTQSEALFEELVAAVSKRWPEALIFNTICHATQERQAEVKALASQEEGLVVVGGRNSANTKRLLQIAVEAGARAFHVETEAELDLKAITGLRSVGVTAGASTPNWLIRKVVEELRSLPGRGQSRLRAAAYRVFRFLLKSNFLVALGGAGLGLAGGLAQRLSLDFRLLAVPFCYLYAMHILNHFLDREAAVYNDPDRIKFYAKHRLFLVATSILATILGLVLSAGLGAKPFLSLLVLSALGLVYSVRIVPERFQERTRYVKLKDFPGSKPLSIALAWGAVLGLWPALCRDGLWLDGLLVSLIVAGLAFIRSALFDVMDIQGDLVVGKETLAIHLGEVKMIRLLGLLSGALVALTAGAVLGGRLAPAAWILAAASAGLAAIMWAYQEKRLLPGVFTEGLVEANFLLAGGLAALMLAMG